jgi:hypothetical protein
MSKREMQPVEILEVMLRGLWEQAACEDWRGQLGDALESASDARIEEASEMLQALLAAEANKLARQRG